MILMVKRRKLLKIGGGILAFTGSSSAAISIMERPAAAVEANFQLSGPESSVETADGELDNLSLSLSEFTIQYNNLTIIEPDNAYLSFGISADVFSGSDIVLAGSLFEEVEVPIKNHSGFTNVLNQDAVENEYGLLNSLEETENAGNQRMFTITDGDTENIEVSVRPYISVNGVSKESADKIQTQSQELEKTVTFDLVNQETTANATIDGSIDAS